METKVTEGFQEVECLEMSKDEKRSLTVLAMETGDIWENSLMEVNMMKPDFGELGRVGEEVCFSKYENEKRENSGMVTVRPMGSAACSLHRMGVPFDKGD